MAAAPPAAGPIWSLAQIEDAVRASWDADTCDPAQPGGWDPGNPARGQCNPTAALLHDLFGGDLLIAEVMADGRRCGYHGWNLLPGGLQVDLTRDQFRPDETVGPPTIVERPAGRPLRMQQQYQLLRDRVDARLR